MKLSAKKNTIAAHNETVSRTACTELNLGLGNKKQRDNNNY